MKITKHDQCTTTSPILVKPLIVIDLTIEITF